MQEQETCQHIRDIKEVQIGEGGVCEECIKNGGDWVHLRTCQTCGETLCCDQSPNKHMTRHHHATGHPVIASAEPGDRWLWCYPDKLFVEY
ncbi:ubiquitin-hydrolase Zn-finger-containing protein [Chitinophaga sp. YR627]|uniref:UBP-type zinc finger domain-containing protein n=1 Tax=Chitinophaga sp. YR627 TaxID=1881041 RepID=UPI0008E32C14|nr:UBP-type zinc finger domain-containing protein [Chitinophaga sp. YR627]SFM60128.1 ubiquitin-hydrolase Zn-finger-containing protein [Chitinophaga sp. YR627]